MSQAGAMVRRASLDDVAARRLLLLDGPGLSGRTSSRIVGAATAWAHLREVFKLKGPRGVKLLDKWCAWARRSRLRPFIDLAASIRAHKDGIVAALMHRLSNARVESANPKPRLITRLALGFHSSAPMIALAMLRLGGLCHELPVRR